MHHGSGAISSFLFVLIVSVAAVIHLTMFKGDAWAKVSSSGMNGAMESYRYIAPKNSNITMTGRDEGHES